MQTPKIISPNPPKCPRLIEAISKSLPATTNNSITLPIRIPLTPTLKFSPLCPNCPSAERIRHWRPANPRNTLDTHGLPTNLEENDLQRIRQVLEEAYAPSTRSTYGPGLFTFHLFCDTRNIDERHRAPIDPGVLASFISALAGIYGGGSIQNFVYGIRAWHIIHGAPWKIEENQLQALFATGEKMAPPSSKKPEKQP
jgi:hypothetical protein